ncbi:hypothetical protein M0805_007271 [Coniferiporia weirii]|nr:hypothetical protein M0805_007271 [Coniferiporia weirii]
MDPTYPLYPIFAFIGFIIVLIPLPWHLQAWNAGTCLYMLWTSLACLNLFVNSIVWHDNVLNPAPVWCDISSRIILGVAVAIPAASLCINRRLYKIATKMSLGTSNKQKRRAVCEDLATGLGIPVIQMVLQYIVSAHRFNIFEDIGCLPVTYNVWLAYPLSATWPIVIGLVSAMYCVLTLRALYKRSTEFNELFAMSPSFNVNRYFRLMALASTELLCTTPFAVYSIYLNLTTGPLIPYRGWADLHFNYSQVDQFPAVIWHLNHQAVISLELNRWLVVACAFIFFGFFGFAEEARNNYRALFLRTASRFGHTPQSKSAATQSK